MHSLAGQINSVPPKLQNSTVIIRANATQVRVIAGDQTVAVHNRCFDRHQEETDMEEPDPAIYDRLTQNEEEFENE